jgi:DNA-binding CsgD family transcriptional regulator
MVLAEMAGYRYATAGGRDYEVIDLGADLVEAGFPDASILRGTSLSERCLRSHFRISFAKNKTDEEFGSALGLQNLLGILPLRDKGYHYRHRLKPWDVCFARHAWAVPHGRERQLLRRSLPGDFEPSKREVAKLAARGSKNAQIAVTLDRSVGAVKSERHAASKRLAVANRFLHRDQ